MSSQPPNSDRDLIASARLQVHPEKGRRVARAARTSLHAVRELDGYDFIREIHRGGQGVVYKAIQRSTGQDVAIKLLRHGAISTPQERARLEREVQVLGQLRHPSIVTVHDSGETNGLPYIVMDFIDGAPLDVYVTETQPTRHELISLFARIAEAVQAAHLRGVIHRDLKPANILVDADGDPHIVDFGLAKLDNGGVSDVTAMTQTGQFLGSIPWAAPEQARGDHASVDVRTDVYALGVVIWRTLTGQFPYEVSGDISTVLRNIAFVTPVQPGHSKSQLNGDIETILRKCLAKEPARRYQNAGELAADLRCHLDNRPIEARRDSTWYVARKTMRRHWLVLSALTLILLIMTGSAAVFAWLYGSAEQARTRAEQRLLSLRAAPYSRVQSLGSCVEDFDDEQTNVPLYKVIGSRGEKRWNPDSYIWFEGGRLVIEPPADLRTGFVFLQVDPARYVLRGDFDVSIEYELEYFPLPEYGTRIVELAITRATDRERFVGIGRYDTPNGSACIPHLRNFRAYLQKEVSSVCDSTWALAGSPRGKLRIRRSGTTYSLFFWERGWQLLLEGDQSDEDAIIEIGSGTENIDTPHRVAFDNLVVETTFANGIRCLETYQDTFSGTRIDPRFVCPTGFEMPKESGGQLHIRKYRTLNNPASFTLDANRYRLCGDFEIRVDVEVMEFNVPPTGWVFARLEVLDAESGTSIAQVDRVAVSTAYGCSPDRHAFRGGQSDAALCDSFLVRAEGTTGAMRIVRRSGKLELACSFGGEDWYVLGTVPDHTDDLVFRLKVGSVDTDYASFAGFDNLHVESSPGAGS